MKANIRYQEQYSRGELLLRSFFGIFYILLPHLFLLFFYGIAGLILQFLSFWVILFTGSYPQNWFEYQEKLQRWNWRLNARLLNMADGYPAFGLDVEDENTVYEVPYHENPDRVSVLMRALFGWLYVLLPHGIILSILSFVSTIFVFFAWWIVLFTGNYPRSMFDFNLKVYQWSARVNIYMAYMTDRYPPFSMDGYGDEDDSMDPLAEDDDEMQEGEYKKSDLV
jgi:hypothetical protein